MTPGVLFYRCRFCSGVLEGERVEDGAGYLHQVKHGEIVPKAERHHCSERLTGMADFAGVRFEPSGSEIAGDEA